MDRRWSGTRRVVGTMALDERHRAITYTLNPPQLVHTTHA